MKRTNKLLYKSILLTMLIIIPAKASSDYKRAMETASEIRYESTLGNISSVGYPLPLAAHWNTGWSIKEGFTPDYQLAMIEKGHYILPSFHLPGPTKTQDESRYGYYEKAFKKAAALNLPFSFISSQWERWLTIMPEYFDLPAEKNPNVVDTDGTINKKVSPFGPVTAWQEIGQKWTSTSLLKQLQAWYPDPPRVFFVSNNEHDKLRWTEVENSDRYMALYGAGRDDDFKREVVGNGWIERYRALQKGMKEGLINDSWKNGATFTGYSAFGTNAFGRWAGWINYSLYTKGRIEPWFLAWDGASLSYYQHDWSGVSDYNVWSMQIQAMNWIFMIDEARNSFNRDFIIELSTWDGFEPDGSVKNKRAYYASLGQQVNPERYEGYVQFGMWLLRPRIVREYRGTRATLADEESYFLSIVRSVDRVHKNETLKKFWRSGRMVVNDLHKHPYQINVPNEYASVERWFLLDTSLDSERPWKYDWSEPHLSSALPVFALALLIGDAPEREWLVYLHSPLKNYKDVKVTIPDYSPINVDVGSSGSFYHVNEKNKTITFIQD